MHAQQDPLPADPENIALQDTMAAPPRAASETDVTGMKRGRFVLLRKLGEGGMALQ